MSRQLSDPELSSSALSSSRLSSGPRYRELANILASEVRSRYRPGELLPAETQLAERFGVNRHTVRRAVDELVAAGMVTRHQGRGTQVVDPRLDYSISAQSKVTATLNGLGLNSSAHCLEQGQLPATPEVAAAFGARAERPLLCVSTLRLVDGKPLMLIDHWFDDDHLPNWAEHYDGGATGGVLQRHYGLRLRRRQVRIEAYNASLEDTLHLQCAKGAALLRIISSNVDEQQRLLEVSVGRVRADRLAYHIDFDEECR